MAGGFVGKVLGTLVVAICLALGVGPDEWADFIITGLPHWVTPVLARTVFLVLAVTVSALLGWTIMRSRRLESEAIKQQRLLEKQRDSTRQVSPGGDPTILARYRSQLLPFAIPPKSVGYVLQLHPKIARWLYEVPNDTTAERQWPADDEIAARRSPTSAHLSYICEFTNHDAKALLNVSLAFDVTFYEPREIAITVTPKPDGTGSTVTMLRPGPNKY